MPNQLTRAQTVELLVMDLVRTAGEIPSGQLYAMACGILSPEEYQNAVARLVSLKLVANRNNLLTWLR